MSRASLKSESSAVVGAAIYAGQMQLQVTEHVWFSWVQVLADVEHLEKIKLEKLEAEEVSFVWRISDLRDFLFNLFCEISFFRELEKKNSRSPGFNTMLTSTHRL